VQRKVDQVRAALPEAPFGAASLELVRKSSLIDIAVTAGVMAMHQLQSGVKLITAVRSL
jgi:hypothetical protein